MQRKFIVVFFPFTDNFSTYGLIASFCPGKVTCGLWLNDNFFNEFTLILPKDAREVARTLADSGILAGVSLGRLFPGEAALANGLVVAVTETTTDEDVDALCAGLKEVLA